MFEVDIKVKTFGLDLAVDLDAFQKDLADEIPTQARRIIDESTPAGKIYRRGSLTGRRTQKGINAGLVPRGRTRMVIGSRFHRASAKGQPPAIDTGKTYRDIRTRKTGRNSYKVIFGGAAFYLEFTLDRPFVLPAVDAAIKEVLPRHFN